MRWRQPVARLLVGLTATILLAGCAAATTPTPAPTASPAPTATPTPAATPTPPPPAPSASPTPTPMSWGPAVLVTGWHRCMGVPGTITMDPDGISSHARGGQLSCTDEANDPRVSGHTTNAFDSDGWGAGTPPGALVEWGTGRLESAGGIWEGTYAGVYTSETGDRIVVWYRGTGDYAGLSYFQLLTPGSAGDVLTGTEYMGLIFPGEPPPPFGTR